MKKTLLLAFAAVIFACGDAPEKKSIPMHPDMSVLLDMMESGQTTSVEIVAEMLRRSAAMEGLNAFITLDADGALQRAQELDEVRESGGILGSLHGVPIVVKDNIHVAGLPNTAGTPALAEFVPQIDNTVIAALREAGAIILGKTNLHELAFGITSDNVAYGAVKNPYDQTMFPGGSSGGTAAAIAAGLAPVGLGTDTGGSARIPAALTGIVGFRPSNNRYESSAVTPISHTRDTIGLLSQTVADLILLDLVIDVSGADMVPIAVADIRLGVPREFYFDNVDAASLPVIEAALESLRNAGVTLVEVAPAGVEESVAQSAFPIALYEVMQDLPAYLETFVTGVDIQGVAAAAASPDVQGLFASLLGDGQMPQEAYVEAMRVREALRAKFAHYFRSNNLDAMIFPTTLLPARPIEGSLQTVELNGEQVPTFPTYIHNTDPASIAALPGISLPVGLTAAGLPVGIELDGPEQSDRRLLAIAAELERVFAFTAHPSKSL